MRTFMSQKGQGWSVGVIDHDGKAKDVREFKRMELESKAAAYRAELEAKYNPAPEPEVEEPKTKVKKSKKENDEEGSTLLS